MIDEGSSFLFYFAATANVADVLVCLVRAFPYLFIFNFSCAFRFAKQKNLKPWFG